MMQRYIINAGSPYDRSAMGILLTGLLLLSLAHAATFHDELTLLAKLFTNYSSRIRPVYNQSTVTIVNIEFSLQAIQYLTWTNELMTWNRWEYGGLDNILMKPSHIWLPDLTIDNGANGYNFIGSDEFLVRLHHDGKMVWYPGGVFETQCAIEISNYPFDIQNCEIRFTLWMNPASRVQLNSTIPVIKTSRFNENGEWKMISTKATSEVVVFEDIYNYFRCQIILKRRHAYHVINTVLPILLLSLLNGLVFVLPPEAGEKMSLSITVLLAYSVFLTIVNEDMPDTSTSISILAIYLIIVLALGTTSTFLSAVVLHYAHDEVGRRRRFFSLDWLRSNKKYEDGKFSNSDVRNNQEMNSGHEEMNRSTYFGNQEINGPTHSGHREINGSANSGYPMNGSTPSGNRKMTNSVYSVRDSSRTSIQSNPVLDRSFWKDDNYGNYGRRRTEHEMRTRDFVDRVDVASFWVFLFLTISGFVVIISVLIAS